MQKEFEELTLNELFDLLADHTTRYSKLYFEGTPLDLLRTLKNTIIALQEEIHDRKEKEIPSD